MEGKPMDKLASVINNPNSSQISRFTHWGTARNYSARTIKPSVILLGDDGKFWVVSMALGAALERAGYEVV
jgi:hypothetical protein